MNRLTVAIAALLATFAGAARAQAPLPFVLKPVGPGVYAAIDGPEHKSGANSGFVIATMACSWSTVSFIPTRPAR